MEIVKVHATAGNDSYNVVKNGVYDAPSTLAQWLVPVDGPTRQFTEADALCYDSGPYNDDGPGIEIERPVTGGLIRPGLSEFRPCRRRRWSGRGKSAVGSTTSGASRSSSTTGPGSPLPASAGS